MYARWLCVLVFVRSFLSHFFRLKFVRIGISFMYSYRLSLLFSRCLSLCMTCVLELSLLLFNCVYSFFSFTIAHKWMQCWHHQTSYNLATDRLNTVMCISVDCCMCVIQLCFFLFLCRLNSQHFATTFSPMTPQSLPVHMNSIEINMHHSMIDINAVFCRKSKIEFRSSARGEYALFLNVETCIHLSS